MVVKDLVLNFIVIKVCLIISAYLSLGQISASTVALSFIIALVGALGSTLIFRKLRV